jgi:hypothetical protein
MASDEGSTKVEAYNDLSPEINGASDSATHRVVTDEQVHKANQQLNRPSSTSQEPTAEYERVFDPPATVQQRQRRVHREVVDLSNIDSPEAARKVVTVVPNHFNDDGHNHLVPQPIQRVMHMHQPPPQAPLLPQMTALRERQLLLQQRQRQFARQHNSVQQMQLEWQQRQNAARILQNQPVPQYQRAHYQHQQFQQQQQQQLQYQQQQSQYQHQQYQQPQFQQPLLPQPQLQQQEQQLQGVSREAPSNSAELPIDYYVIAQHSPMVNPRHASYPILLRQYYRLHGDMACACTFAVLLKMKKREGNAIVGTQSKISQSVNYTYRKKLFQGVAPEQAKRTELPKVLLALACRGCYEERERAAKEFDTGAIHFPYDFPSFLSKFYDLKAHQLQCHNLAANMKQIISGRGRHPEFSYELSESTFIRQLCNEYNLFPPDGPSLRAIVRVSRVDVVYNDINSAMEEALKTTSMTFRGVVGESLCDIVDDDVVADDPMCLFALESLEIVRISKRYSMPHHRHFFTQESVSEDETELFALQCTCCRGLRKDGSLNPDAIVLLRYCNDVSVMKQVVFSIMTLVGVHLQTCLSGAKLQRMESLKASSKNDVFLTLATSLRRHLVTILAWARELEIEQPAEPPSRDQELWTSLPMEQYWELIRTDKAGAVVDVYEPPTSKGSPGSAVFDCMAFPRVGQLHGEIGFPTRDDVKISIRKRRRPAESNGAQSPIKSKMGGSKVSEVTILPMVELPDGKRRQDATTTTVLLEHL